ncbi:hypothetical protein GPJ59_36670, partial [Streptomyces bambusae]|nr:hypothetical protein [Streptomyces bambusae]
RRLAREGARAGPAEELTAALLRLLSAPDAGAADDAARRVADLMARLPSEELLRHPELEPLRLYGRAYAQLRSGDLRTAREGLAEAVRACSGDETVLLRHRCLGRLALAEAADGALTGAEEHAEASLEVADEYGIPEAHRSGAACLALAAVAVERGDLHAAAVHLDRAELLPDTFRDPDLMTERSVLRSQVEIARGRWHAALTVLGEPQPPTAPGPVSYHYLRAHENEGVRVGSLLLALMKPM